MFNEPTRWHDLVIWTNGKCVKVFFCPKNRFSVQTSLLRASHGHGGRSDINSSPSSRKTVSLELDDLAQIIGYEKLRMEIFDEPLLDLKFALLVSIRDHITSIRR